MTDDDQLPTIEQLQAEFNRVNNEYFSGKLKPHTIEWSNRMTSTGGSINVRFRILKLSRKLMLKKPEEVWHILQHEMIHSYLYTIGRPHGHTPEFKNWLEVFGYSRNIHHSIPPIRRQRHYGKVYETREVAPQYCMTCRTGYLTSFDSWVKFEYLQPMDCIECNNRTTIIYHRGFTTRQRAISAILKHDKDARIMDTYGDI